MKTLNPFDVFLWTFRRNEKDVVNLYSTLSDVMRLATGGNMLNFGYWDETTSTPLAAQEKLCLLFGNLAELKQNQSVLDVGSGYGAPALLWKNQYDPIDVVSLNLNYTQLKNSASNFTRLNGTATDLPFQDSSLDRVLAFESAQHFKPLSNFLSESFRILKNNGILALAIPVMAKETTSNFSKLGLLSMTWSSEHYSEDFVISIIKQIGFDIVSFENIGSSVYSPLTNYYENNRDTIRQAILNSYPSYVEKILYKSMKKMRDVSQKNIIDYLLISCKKP